MALTVHHSAKHNLWLHSGFWSVWVVVFALLHLFGQQHNSFPSGFWLFLTSLPVIAIQTYLIAYWLVPFYFFKKRYGLFIAGVLILMVIFSVTELILKHEIISAWMKHSKSAAEGYLNPLNIIISGIDNHYIILVFLAVKTGKAWYFARATEEEEKLVQMETTADTYYYQFRPKVIGRLMLLLECVLKKNAAKSPQVIELISGFLTELLDENGTQQLTPAKEINLLERYFEIFTNALPVNIRINFSAEGDFTLLPATGFLLLPLADYALSLGKWCNKPYTLSLLLKVSAGHLYLNMCCSSDLLSQQQKSFDAEMFERKLRRLFSGSVKLKEERGGDFWKLEADVFVQ